MELHKSDRNILIIYWVVAVSTALIALFGVWQLSITNKEAEFLDAEHSARVLAVALAGHAHQIAVKMDVLSAIVIEDEDKIASNGARTRAEALEGRAAAEPAARAIMIVNTNGEITDSSDQALAAQLNEKQIQPVTPFVSADTPTMWFSPPYYLEDTSRNWSGYTFNFNRKIFDKSGKFTGYVSIVLEGQFLYGFYDNLGDRATNAVGLVGSDGVIRASNRRAAVGRNVENLIKVSIRDGDGHQISTSVVDGQEYLFVYSKVASSALYAYVGIRTAPIIYAWAADLIPIILAAIIMLGSLTAGGLMLHKYVKGRRLQLLSARDAAAERRNREFLQAVLNTGGALVAVTDAKGDLVVANPAFYSVFDDVPRADGQSELEFMFSRKLEQLVECLPLQASLTIKDKDGQRREITWTLNSIRHGSEIEHFVAIGFDVTMQRKAELAVYQAGKMIALGEMTTGLAHEIYQPLSTMGMNIDVLKNRIESGVADREFIDGRISEVSKQIKRTVGIIDRMRIFGRKGDLVPQTFSVEEVISDCLVIMQALLDEKGIQIRVDLQTDRDLFADKILVEQILLNLISNAKDSIVSKGGGQSMITIRARDEDGSTIAIDVIDTGTGFSEAHAAQLFDPFFTTKPVGKGTGLGLPLSFGMASDMGGRIEANNVPEGGACFTLFLPSSTAPNAS
ncbi:hypothetical protein KXR64_20085 [Brucella intermedia]|uniref:sensor histidine kinase n=1 Tax=Brucella TaxID=234 RepID=UPI0009467281|nr:ATP-binding protein [Brucella intermedia]